MPSNPSAILKHYPELGWSVEDFKDKLVFVNAQALAVFTKVFDEAELLVIATHPDYKRQGHAEALLRSSINSLQPCNIYLEVRLSNLAARRLYEKLGFQEKGHRRKYYPDLEDAVLYALGPK